MTRVVEELVTCYEGRRNVFIKACRSIGWNAIAPAGSFFAWLPVPVGFTIEEFADYLLDEDRLVEAVGRMNKLNPF